jgi:diguanylate cyclase (GGDEF)-like protein
MIPRGAPGPSASAARRLSAAPTDDRDRIRVLSYELFECAQTGLCEREILELLSRARAQGWADVECVLHFALLAVGNHGPTGLHQLEAMAEAAERSGDEALVAAAMATRAMTPGAGGERGLHRAVVMLDEVGSAMLHRPVAYVTCARGYHRRGLWELALDMLDRAATSLTGRWPPALTGIADFNRRTIVLNRIECMLPLTCSLIEIGQRDRAETLAASRTRLGPQDLAALPEEWVTEVQAVDYLMAAVAAESETVSPHRLLRALHPTQRQGYRACVLLAQAIRALDAGNAASAAALAESALLHVDEDFGPALTTVCLHISAMVDPPANGWRRYAERQAQLRWKARLDVLDAARSQLEAERVILDNDRISERAYVDELTGLANRHAYARHLRRLELSGDRAQVAALMVDVDRFKEVNDRFGHAVGDDVLRRLGGMLLSMTRATDMAVRLGGDEFMLLLSGRGRMDVASRGEELVTLVRAYPWSDLVDGLQVTVSAGAAVGAAKNITALLSEADHHMYTAKSQGRDRLVHG